MEMRLCFICDSRCNQSMPAITLATSPLIISTYNFDEVALSDSRLHAVDIVVISRYTASNAFACRCSPNSLLATSQHFAA